MRSLNIFFSISFAFGLSAMVSSVHIEKMLIRCPACGELNNLRGVRFPAGFTTAGCSKCNSDILLTTHVLEDITLETASNRGHERLPFTFHNDLIGSQVSY